MKAKKSLHKLGLSNTKSIWKVKLYSPAFLFWVSPKKQMFLIYFYFSLSTLLLKQVFLFYCNYMDDFIEQTNTLPWLP